MNIQLRQQNTNKHTEFKHDIKIQTKYKHSSKQTKYKQTNRIQV